jgi:hypothetical protein
MPEGSVLAASIQEAEVRHSPKSTRSTSGVTRMGVGEAAEGKNVRIAGREAVTTSRVGAGGKAEKVRSVARRTCKASCEYAPDRHQRVGSRDCEGVEDDFLGL